MRPKGYTPHHEEGIHNTADWHVSFVLNDPDFQADLEAIKTASTGLTKAVMIESLAQKSSIPVEAVNLALLPIYAQPHTGRVELLNDEDGGYSISFPFDVTEAEIFEQWEKFKGVREELGFTPSKQERRRPPENPQLLYAIFKARKRGDTFPKIYEQYYAGQLPGYGGANDRFNGGESIETYYNRYYKQDHPIT